MSNFTIKDLRELVAQANEENPLDEPNGYGNTDRYYINAAYGGYQITELIPGTTAQTSVTYGYLTARETASDFRTYLHER